MNCEKCQELLSDFIDGTLTVEHRTLFDRHLDGCLTCAGVREEMRSIVGAAREVRAHHVAPPNERAMWLRIRNTIEVEIETGRAAKSAAANPAPESFWSRWMGRRWELSLPQLTASVAAITVTVALVTTLGLQNFINTQPPVAGVRPVVSQQASLANPVTVGGDLPSHVGVRKTDIEYWQQRVAQRQARWNPRMRAAFDRSMVVINEAVDESAGELKNNPHDEVSEEMLNAALRDKLQLLREFSEY